MKNITIFCFLILTIIGCRKEEEIDYAKEISGDYSGKMSVYPVYFEKDSLNYDEKLTLTYVNSDSIHVSYSKSLTVNDSVKIDKLDFECTCGITLKYDKSVDFYGFSRTQIILISSDNNMQSNEFKEVQIGGNISKYGKAIINFSIIEEPLPITFIFKGVRIN